MPDITLINPPIGQDTGNHPLPYNLWQLASFVKSLEFTPALLDLNFIWRKWGANYDTLKARVLDVDSPIVGFTCMGNNFPTALELATDLKETRPDVVVVFGGPHVSLVGDAVLRTYSCVDYVVVGEGEFTLREMLATDVRDWPNIPGVLSKGCSLTPRALMPTLDLLPPLDLRLLNWEGYHTPLLRDHFAFPLLAGSGCPFSCTFCSTSVMWKRRFRVKSPTRLVREMQVLLAETGCRKFDLVHDIFTANKRYVGEFCAEVTGKDLRWLCSSRIDSLDANEVAQMSSAGCAGIFFGVESASSTVQRAIGKRLKVERILPTLDTCVQQGIDCVCSTLFGLPQETWEDISATAQLCIDARSLGVGRANMHMLMSLPGTEIYRTAKLADQIDERDLRRSSLPIASQRAKGWIECHPNLFSAFRWVEHESITKDEMYDVMSWGTHLATHPESLGHVLRQCHGQLREAIHALSQYSNPTTAPTIALERAAQQGTFAGLRQIFREEQRIATILAAYRSNNLSAQRRFAYWLCRSETKRGILYEVAPDAVTINIYGLTEREWHEWNIPEDTSILTTNDLEQLGPCWPVMKPGQEPRSHYAIH
ncbi:MAG: B12-binding domain-containing radical SAM protein [Deltaproteobacteria bacterium]|nr:B12-binding domain-containing radical SAM protein [Deltaproteobacteria bacterium]